MFKEILLHHDYIPTNYEYTGKIKYIKTLDEVNLEFEISYLQLDDTWLSLFYFFRWLFTFGIFDDVAYITRTCWVAEHCFKIVRVPEVTIVECAK